MKPVAVINQTILLYKRPCSDEPAPWENDNEKLSFTSKILKLVVGFLVIYGVAFVIGFIAGVIMDIIF